MTNWIAFLQNITKETDKIALQYFNAKTLKVDIKANHTPVSQADLEIENHIRKRVKESHPNLSILGEEYGQTKQDSDLLLIIDPIDGTKNFIAGIPFFATLLAIEEKGVVVAGLVSAPARGETWWAQRGVGSFYNGQRIHVSTVDQLDESLALHGSLFGSEATDTPAPLIQLLSETKRQRGFGDYYPAMLVAMGLGEFAADFKLQAWDIAPLKIIVEEAGGQFSDTAGEDTIYSGNIIVSNGKLHDIVQSKIANIT